MSARWGRINEVFGAHCDDCGWDERTELVGADGVIAAATLSRAHNAQFHDFEDFDLVVPA